MEKNVYRAKPQNVQKGSRPGALLMLFCVLLFSFAAVNLFWPKRTTSELENRRLASLPTLTVKGLLSGQWETAFGTWMQDQVAGRDGLLWLESAVNAACLQKAEEGGILLGKDGWMFTKQFDPNAATNLDRNLSALCGFAERWPGKVTFLLAPSAAVTYPEELPLAAPMTDENAALDDIFAQARAAGAQVVDLRGAYTAYRDEYLYYRTDHHWTTQGAWRAYEQFCAMHGLTPFDITAAERRDVPEFYGTHYSATRRWNVRPDVITWYPLPNEMTVYRVNGEADFTPDHSGPLVDESKFAARDKYAAFLGGNNGYTEIEGDGEGSILVIKDSYANCFIPFLTANYARIGVVDFRGYAYGPDSLMETGGYDEALVLYNYQTFIADGDAVNLARPTTIK